MATRKRKKNTGLGIAPAVVAAAAPVVERAVERREQRRAERREYERTHPITLRKVLIGTLVGGIAVYAGVKTFQAIRRNNLMKKGFSNPEVGAAIKIWNAVPDSFKAHWNGFLVLSPFSSVANALTSIKQLWESVNTKTLNEAAKYMHENNLNVTKVSRHFKTLYKIELVDFLNDVLSTDEYSTFNNIVQSGQGSSTPTPEGKNDKGEYLYAVTKDNCYVRRTAECTYTYNPFTKIDGWSISNGVPIENADDSKVPANTVVGQWTGKAIEYEKQAMEYDDYCYFAMMNAIVSSGSASRMATIKNINCYVSKAQVEPKGYTVDELRSEFGDTMKALVYNPVSKKYKLTTINLNN